jgi:ribosomal-protein-serine acetyltransferase
MTPLIIQINDFLVLESNHLSHVEENYALINNNRAYLKQWLTWVDKIQTLGDSINYITAAIQKTEQQTDYGFVIKYNGSIVGRMGLHFIDAINKTGTIGYWIAEGFQGKGIITECCKAIINFGFTELNLQRIEIKCATQNLKSKAIPERLNFKQEGILRQAEFLNNQWTDLYLYSLLKEEWLQNF